MHKCLSTWVVKLRKELEKVIKVKMRSIQLSLYAVEPLFLSLP